MQQQKLSPIISRGGIDIFEIETICELPKVQFLKSTYEIKKIRDRKYEPTFKQLLGVMLVKINSLAGIKTEIDDFTKQDIVKMILSAYSDLSIEEIYKAFELERYSVYESKTEHFQLFDANYISEILKKYKNWKIQEKKILCIDAPKTEIMPDLNKIREEYLKTVFEEIQEKGFSDSAHFLYDDLLSKGKINPTDQEKKKLYKQELAKHITEEKELIKSKDGILIKTLLADLQKKIDSGKPFEYVKNRCKSILVSNYLYGFTGKLDSFKNEL